MKSFTIWQYLLQIYGRSIYLEKEIQERQPYFFIKYLRTLGFDATNDIFAENAWYFRNALVRANYNDLKHEIHETTEYLELFLRNLLLDEKNLLQNRLMHVDYKEMLVREPKIEYKTSEANIENRKVNIQLEKVNIGMFGEKIFRYFKENNTAYGTTV